MTNTVFDPTDVDFLSNPYPVYARLREDTPIFFDKTQGLWFFLRYTDVDALLRDKRLGRSILHIMTREELGWSPEPESHAPFYNMQANMLMEMEPPDHTRLRSLVHKAFTSRQVERLRSEIEAYSHHLLDKLEGQTEFDLLSAYAIPVPVAVIAQLLGVPVADSPKLLAWSTAIVQMYEINRTEAQEQAAMTAIEDFSAYLRDVINHRRQNPTDDLLSHLIQVQDAGDRLTEDELVNTCILLLNAGHEATVNVIGNGLHALLQHPAQREKLRQQPELINSAIEEMLRYDTPLPLFRRWVLEDFSYKGYEFKRGTEVAFLLGSANRDPAQFPNPDQFDISRSDNRHISFGAGIHFCLGAPLARLELQITIRVLLERLPQLELAAAPEYHPTFVFRALTTLPVTTI